MKKSMARLLVLVFLLTFGFAGTAFAEETSLDPESSAATPNEAFVEQELLPSIDEIPVPDESTPPPDLQEESPGEEPVEQPSIQQQLESALSGEASPQAYTLPAPRYLSGFSRSDDYIYLAWNRVYGAEYYIIVRWTDYESAQVIGSTYDNTDSFNDENIQSGITYYYCVVAVANNEIGEFSNIAKITPYRIAAPIFTVSSNGYNSIKITWNKINNADYYEVFRANFADEFGVPIAKINNINTTTFIDTRLATGQTYYYRIEATKGQANNGLFVNIGAKPTIARPTNVQSKAYPGRKIRITWNRSPGAHGYYIYRSTSRNGRYRHIKTVGNVRSFTNNGLRAKQAYYYKVVPYRNVSGSRVRGTSSAITARRAIQ